LIRCLTCIDILSEQYPDNIERGCEREGGREGGRGTETETEIEIETETETESDRDFWCVSNNNIERGSNPDPNTLTPILIDFFTTQLKAQGPSRTCNESKEEEGSTLGRGRNRACVQGYLAHKKPRPPRTLQADYA